METNTDSSSLEKPCKPADDGHEQKVSKGAAATKVIVDKPLMEAAKESPMKVHQHTEVHLDVANYSDIAQRNGNSRTFDFIKARYTTMDL